MWTRQYHSQEGGSLIEVIICAFLLSLSLFNVTALKLTQAHIELQQSQYTAAWSLMAYKLNELRYLTDSSDEFTLLSSNQGGLMTAGDTHYDQHRFDVSWQVSDISNSTLSAVLKQVVVKISWSDKGHTVHEIMSSITLTKDIITR